MNGSIDFAPLLPWPFLWAAAIIGAVLIGILLYRRSRGAAMRAAALAALLAALANPTFKQEERESLSNVAIVVLDESTSQALEQRPEQVRAIKAELVKRLGAIPNLQVKWVSGARPSELGGTGTLLFADLNKALTDTPPDRLAGVIMVTDGQVHDVPKSRAALGFDAPVHALLTGRPEEFDRRIEILKAPRYGLVGQTRDVKLRVVETGSRSQAGDTVNLRIRRDGRPDETRRTKIGSTVTLDMNFPHAGTNIVEVELESAPGELTSANNRTVITAEGVRENLRVLLVSGEPHAGERTWRNLLKSDAAVDLVHFTILRPPEKQDGTPINQLFSEKIKDFDLIIFDRYEHRGILQLPYYDNIARFVDTHGGALLVAAGDDYASTMTLYRTPLAPVLPGRPTGRVLEQPFKAAITLEGSKHPVTKGLPGSGALGTEPSWGHWFRQAEVKTERGRVLLQGAEAKPLLLLDRKGKGRVALLTSDQAWLWARGYEGGGPHTDLLRRLSHWLMKEPDLEEERLIATAKGLKLTFERRSMDDSVKPLRLSAPGGELSELQLEPVGPGVWQTTLDAKLPGLYKAETDGPLGQLTAVAFAGVEDPREMNEVTATDAKLKPLTDQTGGGVFWTRKEALFGNTATDLELPRISMMANADILAGSGWMGLKDREAFVTRGVKITQMFTGLFALAALLGLLALAWWREGR
jgi:hypothetical protein